MYKCINYTMYKFDDAAKESINNIIQIGSKFLIISTEY